MAGFTAAKGFFNAWPKELEYGTYAAKGANKKNELDAIFKSLIALEEELKKANAHYPAPPASASADKTEKWAAEARNFFKSPAVKSFTTNLDALQKNVAVALTKKPSDKAKSALKAIAGALAKFAEYFKPAVYNDLIADQMVAMHKAYEQQLMLKFRPRIQTFKVVASQPGDDLHDAQVLLAAWPANQANDDARSQQIGTKLTAVSARMCKELSFFIKAAEAGFTLNGVGVSNDIAKTLPTTYKQLAPIAKAVNLGRGKNRQAMAALLKTVSDEADNYSNIAQAMP